VVVAIASFEGSVFKMGNVNLEYVVEKILFM